MAVVELVLDVARVVGISATLLLAGVKAEGNLDTFADRFGRRTAEAQRLIAAEDRAGLQTLIDAVWPDVSFGLSQRIVKYHWAGDGSRSVDNVLKVRDAVFANTGRDVAEMADRLRSNYIEAGRYDLTPVGGDRELAALIIYNAGHWPSEPYWQSGRKEHYQRALAWARAQGAPMQVMQIGGVDVFDVRDRFPYVDGRRYNERPLSAITAYVQHHTGDQIVAPAMTIDEAVARLDNAYRWHTGLTPGGHDWPGLGYHFGIDGQGRIYYANGIELVSYHARAANAYGIGVLWLQDLTNTAPNEQMVAAARALYRGLEQELGRSVTLLGHCEAPTNQTECPGRSHWFQTKQAILAGPVAPSPSVPAEIPGFSVVDSQHWFCDLTGGDLAYRMLDLYRKANGLFWLGYPRNRGWRTIDGVLSKVFQRGVVEIKPQYVAADGTVDPQVPALELFQLALLGDRWLRERGEL